MFYVALMMKMLHVDGDINPVRDKEIIDTELQLKILKQLRQGLVKLKSSLK